MNTTQASPHGNKTYHKANKPRLQLLSKKPSSSRIIPKCKRPTRIRYSHPVDIDFSTTTINNMRDCNDNDSSIPNTNTQLYTRSTTVEKRTKLLHVPCWNVPSRISDLPSIPILHIPSTTCTLIRNYECGSGSGSVNGRGRGSDGTRIATHSCDPPGIVIDLPVGSDLDVGKEGSQSPLNPKTIAERIVKSVSSLSSVGNYNDKTASAIIHTMSNVKICIQMYAYDSNNAILLEFNRQKGDTIEYHHTIQTIIHAAKNSTLSLTLPVDGDGDGDALPLSPTVAATATATRIENLADKHHPTHVRRVTLEDGRENGDDRLRIDTQIKDVCFDAIQNVETLIHKDRFDAIELGMQSLSLLTSSKLNTNSEISCNASKAVLIDEHWQNVKTFVFSIVVDSDDTDDDGGMNDISNSYSGDGNANANNNDKVVDVDVSNKLRLEELALTIIANALSTASASLNFAESIDCKEMRELLVVSMRYLRKIISSNSHYNMKLASQAARCILNIVELSGSHSGGLKSAAIELGIINLAQTVMSSCHHAMLEDLLEDIIASLSRFKGRVTVW